MHPAWNGDPARHASEAPIEIVPSDPAWPALFAGERERVTGVLAPWLAGTIEHMGSTAVPGLAAKPIIDILVPVHSLEASRGAIAAAEALGYCYAPYEPALRHWFCRPSFAHRTHHLHLVPIGSPQWHRPLIFRDYLRAHLDAAAEYASVKRELAQQFRADREAYTEAKRPFIDRIIALAIRGGHGT
jgi:GrpB-like predicted nucleotidyltransferase (UPF0157 family)